MLHALGCICTDLITPQLAPSVHPTHSNSVLACAADALPSLLRLHSEQSDSSSDPSSGKENIAAAAAEAAAAAAADAQLRKTANQFGALLANVSDAPRQRYSLAGLGFGLPLSRLHARYFGGCPSRAEVCLHACCGGLVAYQWLLWCSGVCAGWVRSSCFLSLLCLVAGCCVMADLIATAHACW